MKFIDEAIIETQSGNGGKGCVSFRREKHIPRGGPDGGDGGHGGDIIFKTTSRRKTLYSFRFNRIFKAKNGQHGQGKQKTGRSGENCIIEIPVGTLLKDLETGKVVKDFIKSDEVFIALPGGQGGQGNKKFASSTHRAPKFAQPGEPGLHQKFQLELKLLADVGLVGFPNAGKSTLIRKISSARPKVADYPFTTLTPQLGVVQGQFGEPFVVADIPGLIKGAHKGLGLGTQFLRHIERTRLLLHLIDVSVITIEDPLKSYHAINDELINHNPDLLNKEQLIVLNKSDLPDTDVKIQKFMKSIPEKSVFCISALTGSGIAPLIDIITKTIND